MRPYTFEFVNKLEVGFGVYRVEYRGYTEVVPGNSMTSGDNSYSDVLSESILNAISRGADSFEAVCRECKGAFPAEVLAAVHLLDLEHQIPFSKLPARTQAAMVSESWPEPSPMDYEWRFASESAKALGSLAQEHGKRILCLGTPTVFCQLISAGADAYLIDRNPLIAAALPMVSTERVVIADISDLSRFASFDRFDVVVMDPPWYEPHTLFWFKTAANVVATNGVIISTIFPELVRPSAKSERAALFRLFEQLGTLELRSGAVVYETPLFDGDIRENSYGILRIEDKRIQLTAREFNQSGNEKDFFRASLAIA